MVLLIPTVGTMALLAHPGLPLWPYLLCAALTGLGGGNFASSMTNINAFYPQRLKGWALALNAGGGNLGVPIVQLVGLLVIASFGNRQPYAVCAIYLVLLAVAAIGAALYMDNLEDYQIQLGTMRAVLSERHTWVIALLYIGTFGSFIGFSFALGQVLQMNFLASGQRRRRPRCTPLRSPFGTAIGLAVADIRRSDRRPHRWWPRHPWRILRHDPRGRNIGQRKHFRLSPRRRTCPAGR